MRRARFVLASLGIVAALAGCRGAEAPAPAVDPAARVTALADAYVEGYFAAFPEQALLAGAPDPHPDRLGDHALPALRRWEAREDELLGELRAIDPKALDGKPELVSYRFLQNQLENAQRFRRCRMELWNVSPTWTGWPSILAGIAGSQPVGTDAEREAALARFAGAAAWLDTEVANLREGLRLGYSAPQVNVASVLEQVDALLAAPVEESPLVQAARPDAPAAFRERLIELETTAIRPAETRYRDFLRDEYLAAAREAVGVDANPEGAACYREAIRYHSTADLTPEEVHRLGLEQVTAIRGEMAEIGARSFATDDPDALLARVKTEPGYLFASREALVDAARSAVERARLAAPAAFGRLPRGEVVVEPYPSFQEKAAPGGFYNPPTGGRPGLYQINAYEAEKQSRAGLEATAFHETYPGHHLQGSIALERADLHPISRYFFLSGFGEGWALYSERLADEMGLYTGDVDRVGLLSNEAHRAARLVVDTGMHALGWSRRQAVDYLTGNTALTAAIAEAEINRYLAVPGQATSYMIGNLEIRRLRREAEAALGPAFDLGAFHDAVLEDGAVPLWVLRDKIERWVLSRR